VKHIYLRKTYSLQKV